MIRLVLMTLVLTAPSIAFAGSETAVSTTVAAPATAAASTLKSPAEIQACLDKITKDNWDAQVKALADGKKNGSTGPVYNYHPVTAADLPQDPPQCAETITTIENVRTGLKRQIENCKKHLAGLTSVKTCPQPERILKLGCRQVTETDYCLNTNKKMLELAKSAKDFSSFMASTKTAFDWYKNEGRTADGGGFKKGDTRYTAYYAPSGMPAAHQRSSSNDGYFYPVYKAPNNLVDLGSKLDPTTCKPVTASCGNYPITGQPHKWCLDNHDGTYSVPPTRAEINSKALAGKDLEIAYLKNIEDITTIDIEGSARLAFGPSDGISLNYASRNGGVGWLPSTIMQCAGANRAGSWKDFLNSPDHVARKFELINYNQSYTFWQPSEPAGVEDILLTPGVSLATNTKEVPTGAVTMYNTVRPNTKASDTCSHRTSMGIAQDGGSAINDHHVDIYMGEGDAAKALASLSDPGPLYMAVVKGAGTAAPNCQ